MGNKRLVFFTFTLNVEIITIGMIKGKHVEVVFRYRSKVLSDVLKVVVNLGKNSDSCLCKLTKLLVLCQCQFDRTWLHTCLKIEIRVLNNVKEWIIVCDNTIGKENERCHVFIFNSLWDIHSVGVWCQLDLQYLAFQFIDKGNWLLATFWLWYLACYNALLLIFFSLLCLLLWLWIIHLRLSPKDRRLVNCA